MPSSLEIPLPAADVDVPFGNKGLNLKSITVTSAFFANMDNSISGLQLYIIRIVRNPYLLLDSVKDIDEPVADYVNFRFPFMTRVTRLKKLKDHFYRVSSSGHSVYPLPSSGGPLPV